MATRVNHGRLTKIIYLLHPQSPLLDARILLLILWWGVLQNVTLQLLLRVYFLGLLELDATLNRKICHWCKTKVYRMWYLLSPLAFIYLWFCCMLMHMLFFIYP